VGTTNDVLVSYVNGEVPRDVVAFALNITVTNGTITAVNDTITTVYTIHPGSIVIVDGNVTDWGSVVASPNDLPSDTLGGIGTSGITIEMGALTTPPGSEPNSGNLLKFTVTPVVPTQNSVVTIAKNAGRGGVVLTDPNLTPTFVASGCTVVRPSGECYAQSRPDYATWVAVGKPPCWCFTRQCYGDTDNGKEGSTKTGFYYVHFNDMSQLLKAFNILEPATSGVPSGLGIKWNPAKPTDVNICADIKHDQEGSSKTGYYRVHFNDIAVILSSFNILEPATSGIPSGPGVKTDCLTK